MIDIKQLKGNLDLAQMNHAAFNTEASKTALEKAQADYDTALSGTLPSHFTGIDATLVTVPPVTPSATVGVPAGLLVTKDSAADHDKAGVGGSDAGDDAQKKSV